MPFSMVTLQNQHISRSRLYAACIDSNDGAFPIIAVPFIGSSMQFYGCIQFPVFHFFDSPYPGVKVCMVHIAFFCWISDTCAEWKPCREPILHTDSSLHFLLFHSDAPQLVQQVMEQFQVVDAVKELFPCFFDRSGERHRLSVGGILQKIPVC